VETRKVEKNLETKRFLEISQRKVKMIILHVAYEIRKIMPRNVVDDAENHNVDTVINLGKNCYSKNKHQVNFIEELECEKVQLDYDQHLFYATQYSNDELSRNW